MSEPMAIEILTSRWLASTLGASVSHARYPIQGPSRGYSDIDAIAYSRASQTLGLAECKVQGSSRHVDPIRASPRTEAPRYYGDVVKMVVAVTSTTRNGRLPGALETRWTVADEGPEEPGAIRHLRVVLVANIVRVDVTRDAMDAAFTEELREDLDSPLKHRSLTLEGRLLTPLEIIAERYRQVRDLSRTWGRRSGHPQDDLLRELARYADGTALAREHLLTVLSGLTQPEV